jgi:hypothetical protein
MVSWVFSGLLMRISPKNLMNYLGAEEGIFQEPGANFCTVCGQTIRAVLIGGRLPAQKFIS